MPVELTLKTSGDQLQPFHAGQPLAEPTPLADLPRITTGENPYELAPYDLGERLFAALGGDGLVQLLEQDEEGLLLLVTDEAGAAIPWEYALNPESSTFLVCDYGFLRLLPEARPAAPAPAGPLNFVVLAADPLVLNDTARTPRTGYKLDIENELRQIGQTLLKSGQSLTARRMPPTQVHLRQALVRPEPAVLHLSCHGTIIPIDRPGRPVTQEAILLLEDADGVQAPLPGSQLLRLPPRGVLRLVVFSVCHTAAGATDASLARAMVMAGTPAALGMQGAFLDPLSDDLAAGLYQSLLAGFSLAESLRQTRQALSQYAEMVGLLVAYVAPGGWAPLSLQAGRPEVVSLSRPHRVDLPVALAAPHPFLGREEELHDLARHYSQGHKVVTVVGSGGIGKSALSAAFAERFGWRFDGGVIGLTLANRTTLAPEPLFRELLESLTGAPLPDRPAELSAENLAAQFLQAARPAPPLLLLDNYETILQLLESTTPAEAHAEIEPDEDPDLIQNPKSKIKPTLAASTNSSSSWPNPACPSS